MNGPVPGGNIPRGILARIADGNDVTPERILPAPARWVCVH
ncbi:hypothetical protein D1AOALGA4SA_7557 [Olavius algarvensis Delta 1 endosymbiont]|nr:hypothetical protein D1AOALGA4SA_7557 [Olavius algarvensis Delta 1 endosymbiont]